MRLLSKHLCTLQCGIRIQIACLPAVLFQRGFVDTSMPHAHAELCTTLPGQQSVQVLRWI